MIFLAKVGLTVVGTIAVAGAYTFREGVARVDVDEYREGGSHVHLWAPAAAVPMVVQFIPAREFQKGSQDAKEFLPVAASLAHELGKLPDSVLVEVKDRDQHVIVSTQGGAIKIDVTDQEEQVHVTCPLSTLEDLTREVAEKTSDSGSGSRW